MYYIGVDLGTSAVKLLLMDGDGKVKKTVSKRYAEPNPNEWWKSTVVGLKEIIKVAEKDKIAGISFCGSNSGLVILDENDELIRPDIVWKDVDTSKEINYLKNVVGKEAFAKAVAPKMLWLADNAYESFRRINKIMLPKDYLVFKLTGIYSTDYASAAATLLYDAKTKGWSKEMLAICELKEEWLPDLYESSQKIDRVLPSMAEELGLPDKCFVVAGTAENVATVIGSGAIGAGRYSLIESRLSTECSHKWWMENIVDTDDFDGELASLNILLDEGKLGENKVYYLPGIMSETAFVGMNMDTTRADILQAILEGIAYALRNTVEVGEQDKDKPESIALSGEVAKSFVWKTIIANVLNIRVDTVAVEEGPVYGTAILAVVANGEYESVESASRKMVTVKDSVEPDEQLVEQYQKGYEKFLKYYKALKSI